MGGEALGLVHGELHAEHRLQVVQVEVHDTGVAVAVLQHVGAEPNGLAVLQGVDDVALQLLHRHVQVQVATFGNLVGILDGVHAAIGLVVAGHVDDADVVVQVDGHVLLQELQRGDAEVSMVVALGIVVGEVELLHRLTEAHGQHAVHLVEHFLLDGRSVLVLLGHGAQLQGVLAQQVREHRVQLGGVVGAVGLGLGLVRHHAVLLHQGAHHIPVAAVGHGRREQPVDLAVTQRLVSRGHRVLEEPSSALKLVEERQVGLGQLEGALRQIQLLLNVEAQHVQAGEHPAAARHFLVGHGLIVHVDGKREALGAHALEHLHAFRRLQNAVLGHRTLGHVLGFGLLVRLGHLRDLFL